MAGGVALGAVIAGRIARWHELPGVIERRQTSAGEDDHAVRTFGPDAGRGSDHMTLTTPVLWPPGDEIVRAGDVATTFFL
jgi:hypothetical protein